MRQKKSRANVYILLAAVIIAAIAAYHLPTKRPDNASMLSPKDYIRLVEQKKAQRLRYEQEQQQHEAQDTRPTSPSDP